MNRRGGRRAARLLFKRLLLCICEPVAIGWSLTTLHTHLSGSYCGRILSVAACTGMHLTLP